MYIDKGFVKYTNTQWDALKMSFIKRNIGQKLWFLHQYCELTGREPELLRKVEKMKEEKVEFLCSTRKVRLGRGYCYGWEGTFHVADIKLSEEQLQETKTWYRRIKSRKDSVVVLNDAKEKDRSK